MVKYSGTCRREGLLHCLLHQNSEQEAETHMVCSKMIKDRKKINDNKKDVQTRHLLADCVGMCSGCELCD